MSKMTEENFRLIHAKCCKNTTNRTHSYWFTELVVVGYNGVYRWTFLIFHQPFAQSNTMCRWRRRLSSLQSQELTLKQWLFLGTCSVYFGVEVPTVPPFGEMSSSILVFSLRSRKWTPTALIMTFKCDIFQDIRKQTVWHAKKLKYLSVSVSLHVKQFVFCHVKRPSPIIAPSGRRSLPVGLHPKHSG